jgi:hypothetical protein
MDVMAGTGTLMVGALINRDIICIEISEKYHNIQVKAMEKLEKIEPGVSEHISLLNTPCQKYLPIPNLADHIVFSPQYSGILKTKGTDSWNKDTGYDFAEYSKNPLNLGTMSEFIWSEEMEKVYMKCYKTLKSPGSMTLIIKDHMDKGSRVQLTKRAIDASVRCGFKYDPAEHFKWAAPGMPYSMARKAKGITIVEDEDIVILRKELRKVV